MIAALHEQLQASDHLDLLALTTAQDELQIASLYADFVSFFAHQAT